MKLYICKPDLGHLFQRFPGGLTHQIHKWTAGILLVDHTEPDGRSAAEHHADLVLIALFRGE